MIVRVGVLAAIGLALAGCPASQVGTLTGPGVLPEPAPPMTAPVASRATPSSPSRPPPRPEPSPPEDAVADDPDSAPVAVVASDPVLVERVRFAGGKAVLDAPARLLLDQVAAALAAHPEVEVLGLEGHRDDRERAGLDLARAEAARRYLIGKGVDGARLTVVGHGARQPRDTAPTEAARANNRRVELVVALRVDAPRG